MCENYLGKLFLPVRLIFHHFLQSYPQTLKCVNLGSPYFNFSQCHPFRPNSMLNQTVDKKNVPYAPTPKMFIKLQNYLDLTIKIYLKKNEKISLTHGWVSGSHFFNFFFRNEGYFEILKFFY
jgi:hypothetical protein